MFILPDQKTLNAGKSALLLEFKILTVEVLDVFQW